MTQPEPNNHPPNFSRHVSRLVLFRKPPGLLVEGATEHRSVWNIPPDAEAEVIRVSFTAETPGEFQVFFVTVSIFGFGFEFGFGFGFRVHDLAFFLFRVRAIRCC